MAELIAAIRTSFEHQGRQRHWFRGHTDGSWALVPAIHRRYSRRDEVNMTGRFRFDAPTRHTKCPEPNDFTRWICLMQHYGLPTRLLDWSESPLVAAYFAVIHERGDSDAAIWCLCAEELNYTTTARRGIAPITHKTVEPLLRAAFLFQGESPANTVAVTAERSDLRMAIQQSAFTIHGNASPLELHPGADAFLRKFVIPAGAREDLRHELWILGMRRSLLFPDLQSLAWELAFETRFKKRPAAVDNSFDQPLP